MKRSVIIIAIIFGSLLFSLPGKTQSYNNTGRLGLPGDNFNLYGALSMFQQCQTLEEFEQKLNAEDTKINNLDLDGDGRIDYVKVIDNVSGNAHIIVLRDILNENESQDVAVIEVEKDKYNKIQIQMIGDLALYGKDYIVEPAPSGTPNPGYTNNINNNVSGGNVYEYNYYYTNDRVGHSSDFIYAVGAWSIIHYIFAPNYVVYSSPYRYGYYPSYWHPWRPMYYDDYYGHWHNHNSYTYFHNTHNYNVPSAHTYYGPRRTSSVVVHKRIERGEYKKTYDRTVVAPKGNRNNRTQNNAIRNQNRPIKADNRRVNQQNTTTRTTTPTNRPGTNVNNNSRPTPKTETKQNNNQNVRPVPRQETRQNNNQNNRPTNRQETTPTNSTPNSTRSTGRQDNHPAINNNNRQETKPATRQETKPATRQETRPTQKTETRTAPKSESKPVEKKQERKDPERK